MPAALPLPEDISALAEALRGPLLRVSRKLRQEAQKVGLSAQDALILGYIKKNPGAGVSELADFEQISRPTMSSHVKRLEAAGWLSRTDDAEDGRRQASPSRQRACARSRRSSATATTGWPPGWCACRPPSASAWPAAAAPLLKLVSLDA